MEKQEKVLRWLGGADSTISWTVDSLSKRSRSGALFPQGTKTLSRAVDILGNERVRVADSYLIKLRLPASGEQDGMQNASLINALVSYISSPMPGEEQVMTPGKVTMTSDGSTAVYQLTLTIEYDRSTM